MTKKNETKSPVQNLLDMYLDNADLKIMLKISASTIRRWRAKKILRYSKVGGKYYYHRASIAKILTERNA